MKKVYLILLVLISLVASEVVGQTTYRLNSNVTLRDYANGNTLDIRWDNPGAWSPSAPPVSGGSGTIIVPSGVILTLGAIFRFNGRIEVQSGGALVFDRDNPNAGELVMDANSAIVLQSGASISSTGPAGDQHNYLQVGASKINGSEINSLPSPPFVLDKNYVECIDNNNVGACQPSTQPVTLLYFKVSAQKDAVKIEWASSKAWDFSHYELERSENGKEFYQIAVIDAEENTNENVKFSSVDYSPVFGTSYYRLKAVDIDGKFEYKGIEVVKFGAESFKVYPNPSTSGFVTVDWSHSGEGATVVLKDNTGRTVRSAPLNGQNNKLDTNNLPAGMYLLTVQGAAGKQQTQLMVR